MMTRRLDMDFAARAVRGRQVGTMLVAIGLALGAVVFERYETVNEEQSRWEARLSDTQRLARRALPSLAPEEAPSRELAQELRQANGVLDDLTLDWDGLFADVESAVTGDVALLGMQPSARGGTVLIDGEARDWNAMLTFLARLEATARLSKVHLVSHEVRMTDPQQPVGFKVQATWTSVR